MFKTVEIWVRPFKQINTVWLFISANSQALQEIKAKLRLISTPSYLSLLFNFTSEICDFIVFFSTTLICFEFKINWLISRFFLTNFINDFF